MVVVELDENHPGQVRKTTLGKNQVLQHVVRGGTWFGAYPATGTEYSLVGCTVSPGFEFTDFELADPFILKKQFPKATVMINKMTKGLTSSAPNSSGKALAVGRKRKNSIQSHPVFRTSPTEKPRQLLNSLALFAAILYCGHKATASSSSREASSALSSALSMAFLSFELFVFLQTRDLITLWPHPGFWRLVFGAGAFYALVLVAMLNLDFMKARWIFESILGDIGTWDSFSSKMQSVKSDTMSTCDVTPMSVFKQIFMAPWFLSHALGWCGKMMIFRDWRVCLIAALFFEFTELTFTYVVPEFEECWWDSVFLDTLGANLLGMWMGTYVNRWTAASAKKEGNVGSGLDWSGAELRTGEIDQLTAMVSPLSTPSYKWKIFSSPLRLLQVCVLIAVMLFIEINTFLMMNTMGIPHDSVFNKLRLALFGFLSLPAAAEWYVYIEQTDQAGADVARIGPACWLCMCCAVLENCLFWKFFPAHFVEELGKLNSAIPIPQDILIKHLIAWVLFLTWVVLRFKVIGSKVDDSDLDSEDREIVKRLVSEQGKLSSRRRASIFKMVPSKVQEKIVMMEGVDLILYAALVPLFALCVNWKFD